jgi:hypothetical protein
MTDANVSISFTASVADFLAGVEEAKQALLRFSEPFSKINEQLASVAGATSHAFSADRVQPYRDALIATRTLEKSFAADSVRAAAALRSDDDQQHADAVKGAQLAIAEEMRLLADGTRQKLALYAEEARFYEISQAERVALSRKALDEEYQLDLAALQRREALGEQSLAARQRIDIMIIEAARRRDDELGSLTRSALKDEERSYQSFSASISEAFTSQCRGLLSGTETWRTAFRKTLDDLLIRFIEWTQTMVAHHLIGEAMKTAATTAGAAARAEADETAATASIGAQGAAMVRSILSSAAETFAGVFGFLAPVMGPLAAGPAAAAQATVAGMASAVASADIGIWQVPKDMLTLVHHNELVMPAAEAGAFRSLLGDKGSFDTSNDAVVHIHPTTNIHVSALDAGSVAQWMRGNSGTMLKEIDRAVRHGAALGLKRLQPA